MNLMVIVFWTNVAAIVAIGAGVIYTVVRDLLVEHKRK